MEWKQRHRAQFIPPPIGIFSVYLSRVETATARRCSLPCAWDIKRARLCSAPLRSPRAGAEAYALWKTFPIERMVALSSFSWGFCFALYDRASVLKVAPRGTHHTRLDTGNRAEKRWFCGSARIGASKLEPSLAQLYSETL
jgi:hypothetical protein